MRVLAACRLTLLGVAIAAMGACGSDPAYPDVSVTQQKFLVQSQRWSSRVLLFVVDDAPTERARALREWLAQEFAEQYESGLWGSVSSCFTDDPGVWWPVGRRVIVVSASDFFATPRSFATDPSLEWSSERRTDEDEAAWVAAVGDAIRATEVAGSARYEPIAAASRWLGLLLGLDAPATPDEQAVVDGLEPGTLIDVFLAGTRDDEGTAPPEDSRVPYNESVGIMRAAVPDETFEVCGLSEAPRIAAWTWLEDFQELDEPCDRHRLFEPNGVADCFPRCFPRVPAVDPDGVTACSIMAYAAPDASCDAAVGWRDPKDANGVRRPRLEAHFEADEEMRVCEAVQLAGPALEACRTDYECEGCEPGWCSTDVEEVKLPCSGPGSRWPLRFTGGATTAQRGILELTCNLQ